MQNSTDQNKTHPPLRIRKNVFIALKVFAQRQELANGTRFSMSAFASDAILRALSGADDKPQTGASA